MNLLTFVVTVYFQMTGPLPHQYTVEAPSCVEAQDIVNRVVEDQEPVVMYCTTGLETWGPVQDVRFYRPMGRLNQPPLPQETAASALPTVAAR